MVGRNEVLWKAIRGLLALCLLALILALVALVELPVPPALGSPTEATTRSQAGTVYSTYFGGGGEDDGRGIAVDAAGSISVTGQTASTDFPTTAGAADTTFNGIADVFVAKISW